VFHIEPTELFPQVSLTLLKRTLFEVCGLYNPPKEIEKTRENSFCSFVSLPFVWHFSDFLFSYLPIVFSRKTFKWKSFIECDIPTPTPSPAPSNPSRIPLWKSHKLRSKDQLPQSIWRIKFPQINNRHHRRRRRRRRGDTISRNSTFPDHRFQFVSNIFKGLRL